MVTPPLVGYAPASLKINVISSVCQSAYDYTDSDLKRSRRPAAFQLFLALMFHLSCTPFSLIDCEQLMNTKRLLSLAASAVLAIVPASAIQAAGVSVGSSSLIGGLDYSDSFTVGTAPRTDGLYNDNSGGAYSVESTYGNPAQTWTPTSNFSFNSGEGSTCCGYPANTGAANAGADAATGLAQSGGGDFGLLYGLDSAYTIQADAIVPGDRFDISSTSVPGNFFAADSLSVFFRNDGIALPSIGIYNPAVGEVAVPAATGIALGDRTWHNFAVSFDQTGKTVKIYVDESLKASLDLTTFGGVNLGGAPVAPGSYQNWSNAAVGMGGAGGVFWADNFQVGPTVPEPSTWVMLAIGAASLAIGRRRAAKG
jgi:hypothetical protein